MINVDSFLAEVAENRRQAQSAARSGCTFAASQDDFPADLDLILKHGGLIQPQLARSPFAPRAARVGVPTRDREQVEYWWRCYGDEANWTLDTQGASMLAIEFSAYIEPYRLFRRPGEHQAFTRTLRFRASTRGFALFSIPPGRSISRGWHSCVHWRNPLLIPPSRLLSGSDENEVELSYLDPTAPLLPAFETLLGPPVRPF